MNSTSQKSTTVFQAKQNCFSRQRSGNNKRTWNNLFLLALILLSTTSTGCQVFGRFNKAPPQPPPVADANRTLDQWLIALNDHSRKISQLKTDVRVAMEGAPTMRGNLSIEHPKRLRMKAGVAGITAIDVGSNNELFWIQTKAVVPGEQPTLMYARHIDFETSPMRRQIPMDPSWLIDGLGFTKFLPTDRHEGPIPRREDGMFEIVTYRQTGTGMNVRKCVVNPKNGLVVQQSFYDQKGNLIAWLNSEQHKFYRDENVSLPQRVVLNVVGPELNGGSGSDVTRLVIDCGDYSINSLYGDPDRLWSMPSSPDVNKVDLSTVQPVVEPVGESANQAQLQFQRRNPVSRTEGNIFR